MEGMWLILFYIVDDNYSDICEELDYCCSLELQVYNPKQVVFNFVRNKSILILWSLVWSDVFWIIIEQVQIIIHNFFWKKRWRMTSKQRDCGFKKLDKNCQFQNILIIHTFLWYFFLKKCHLSMWLCRVGGRKEIITLCIYNWILKIKT